MPYRYTLFVTHCRTSSCSCENEAMAITVIIVITVSFMHILLCTVTKQNALSSWYGNQKLHTNKVFKQSKYVFISYWLVPLDLFIAPWRRRCCCNFHLCISLISIIAYVNFNLLIPVLELLFSLYSCLPIKPLSERLRKACSWIRQQIYVRYHNHVTVMKVGYLFIHLYSSLDTEDIQSILKQSPFSEIRWRG